MGKKKLFPLSAGGELEIVLRVRAQGENFKLVHVFREPTAADKKAFWGHISRVELLEGGRSGGGSMDYLGANELLYNRCIQRVEGYDLPESAASRPESWKELIPLEHKLWAVEELLARANSIL